MKKLLTIVCTLAAMAACSSDDGSNENIHPAVMAEGRTVLVYMSAENSLSPHVTNCLEQMKTGGASLAIATPCWSMSIAASRVNYRGWHVSATVK